ncbi:hypothetical protein SRABI118_02440 [Massilia sp. Bi118]|uniref:hypothetical protein n=1 Tax=Massilia sp. Bi118 TaxID=2822346 RepID=UPI001D7B148C|nr:hypothetical protein [Massilia sp. Bi118]CAH0229925.1 hypothetical protein SRABI118_02440 [Massilia sp. Bi118]
MKMTNVPSKSNGNPPLFDKDPVRLGEQLKELHDEFKSAFVRLAGYWLANFENANRFILDIIDEADCEVQPLRLAAVYVSPKSSNALRNLHWSDVDQMTLYGQMIAKIRYSIGYFGNMWEGQVAHNDHCSAMIFAYEAYWRGGNDYFVGSVVETVLKRLPDPSEWRMPPAAALRKSPYGQERQKLAIEIANASKALSRYYFDTYLGIANSSNKDAIKPEMNAIKPEMIDFRERFAAVRQMGAANVSPRNRGD